MIDMLAPETDICSAVPSILDTDGVADGVQCDYRGTSMATPQVAGAIAMLRQRRPAATVQVCSGCCALRSIWHTAPSSR